MDFTDPYGVSQLCKLCKGDTDIAGIGRTVYANEIHINPAAMTHILASGIKRLATQTAAWGPVLFAGAIAQGLSQPRFLLALPSIAARNQRESTSEVAIARLP